MGDDYIYSFSSDDEKPHKFNVNKKNSKKNKPKDIKYSNPNDGFIRIGIEKNKRGGKTVSTAYGFDDNTDLNSICSDLKKKCGSGGTVKDSHIEIQGDKRDQIEKYLNSKEYKTKKVGG